MTAMRSLSIKAVDNHGKRHPVSLVLNETGKWVLGIDGTPAQWHLDDFVDARRCPRMAIDFGCNWYCENFDDVLAEAFATDLVDVLPRTLSFTPHSGDHNDGY